MFQFIDLCILLGCDYCDSIKGIGPKRAVELINQYRNIETIIDNIDKSKYPIPEDWNYQVARELFVSPEITDPNEIEVRIYCQYSYLIIILSFFFLKYFYQLKWVEPDEEGIVKYLCGDRQFNEERIRNGVKKIMKSRSTSTQGRLDSFFKVCVLSPVFHATYCYNSWNFSLQVLSTTPKRKPEDDKKNVNKKIKLNNSSAKKGRKPK